MSSGLGWDLEGLGLSSALGTMPGSPVVSTSRVGSSVTFPAAVDVAPAAGGVTPI